MVLLRRAFPSLTRPATSNDCPMPCSYCASSAFLVLAPDVSRFALQFSDELLFRCDSCILVRCCLVCIEVPTAP